MKNKKYTFFLLAVLIVISSNNFPLTMLLAQETQTKEKQLSVSEQLEQLAAQEKKEKTTVKVSPSRKKAAPIQQKQQEKKENVTVKVSTQEKQATPKKQKQQELNTSTVQNKADNNVHVQTYSKPPPAEKVVPQQEKLQSANSMTTIFTLIVTLAVFLILINRRRNIMKWFYDLKISTKLILTFGIVAVIAALIGWVGYTGVTAVAKNGRSMYLNRLEPIRDLGYANAALLIRRGDIREMLLVKNKTEREKLAGSIKEQTEKVTTLIDTYSKRVLVKEEEELLPVFQENWKKNIPLVDEAVTLALQMSDKESEAIVLGDGIKVSLGACRKTLAALADVNAKVASELDLDSQKEASSATMQIIIFIVAGIGLAMGLGIFIARIISKPVIDIAAKAEMVAGGDLTVEVTQTSNDEVGHLAASFKRMIENLRDIIGQVGEASSSVASASSEISSSTEQMAAGAQEQTSQANEVASAVEEMTKTILENSKNANDTAGTAKKARAAAEQGGKAVEDTVVGMKRIAEVVNKSAETVKTLGKSSDQIGEIVSVIDDIADQTNLLALNAAIEAARAGEQGRGFAVVADEVRKLAERTTKATKEIAGMIKTIQVETTGAVSSMEEGTKQVDEGIKLADKAGTSLHEIVELIQTLTDMVTQIAAASEQQSQASDQISKNVEGISAVTGETASGTQQIARAAEDLNGLTENLQRLVERFKLSTADSDHHTETYHPEPSHESSSAQHKSSLQSAKKKPKIALK